MTAHSDLQAQAERLAKEVVDVLRARGLTLGFAESCTGGLASSILTQLPGVSDVYLGSIVAYAYSVKEQFLGVSSSLLRVHGAVSLPVARAMAEGARKALRATWVVSVTGIAGPGGGTPQKPVGTVCFGICGPGIVTALVERHEFAGDRRAVQLASVIHAYRLLLRELRGDSVVASGSKARRASKKPVSRKKVAARKTVRKTTQKAVKAKSKSRKKKRS